MNTMRVTREQLKDLMCSSGYVEAEHTPWRWGDEVRFLVTVDGKPYLTDFIRRHVADGLQWEEDTYVLTPAQEVVVTVKKWVEL